MAPRPGEGPMKVLVATDGLRGGMAALRFAVRLADRDPSTALIVVTIGIDGSAPPHQVSAPRRSAESRRARQVMESAARLLGRRGVRADLHIVRVRSGEPIPEAISREADRMKADLVVVGSEGRDTLREWVVGGVALRLIYVARRPVTVVRPPRRQRRS